MEKQLSEDHLETDHGPGLTAPGLVTDLMSRLNREVIDKLAGARQIGHPGESGRARENVVADALRRFLPDAYGISSGFVIDGTGGQSRQQDVVIFRRGYHPVFTIGGVDHFMVESVAAVLQNRARITNRKALIDAIDTIASAKRLDRTNNGTNYVVHGSNRGEMVDARQYNHQIFAAIVTEASLARETLLAVVAEYLRTHDRRVWLNVYADVNGSAGLFQKPDLGTTDDPYQANRWVVTTPEENDVQSVPPFVELLGHLANYLRVAPLVDYKPSSYLPHYVGPVRYRTLDDTDMAGPILNDGRVDRDAVSESR